MLLERSFNMWCILETLSQMCNASTKHWEILVVEEVKCFVTQLLGLAGGQGTGKLASVIDASWGDRKGGSEPSRMVAHRVWNLDGGPRARGDVCCPMSRHSGRLPSLNTQLSFGYRRSRVETADWVSGPPWAPGLEPPTLIKWKCTPDELENVWWRKNLLYCKYNVELFILHCFVLNHFLNSTKNKRLCNINDSVCPFPFPSSCEYWLDARKAAGFQRQPRRKSPTRSNAGLRVM